MYALDELVAAPAAAIAAQSNPILEPANPPQFLPKDATSMQAAYLSEQLSGVVV